MNLFLSIIQIFFYLYFFTHNQGQHFANKLSYERKYLAGNFIESLGDTTSVVASHRLHFKYIFRYSFHKPITAFQPNTANNV
jgi:hypothetical protein